MRVLLFDFFRFHSFPGFIPLEEVARLVDDFLSNLSFEYPCLRLQLPVVLELSNQTTDLFSVFLKMESKQVSACDLQFPQSIEFCNHSRINLTRFLLKSTLSTFQPAFIIATFSG